MEITVTERVSANVRAEIARKRLTQTEMAKALGMTQQMLSRRVNGYVEFSVNELVALATLLGTTTEHLLRDETELEASA